MIYGFYTEKRLREIRNASGENVDRLVLITLQKGLDQRSNLYITMSSNESIQEDIENHLIEAETSGRWEGGIRDIGILLLYALKHLEEVKGLEVRWTYIPRAVREAGVSKLSITRKGKAKKYKLEPIEVAKYIFQIRDSHPTWTLTDIAAEVASQHIAYINEDIVKSVLQNEDAYKTKDTEKLTLLTFEIGGCERTYALYTKLDEDDIKEILDSSITQLEDEGKFDGTVNTHKVLIDLIAPHATILNNTIEFIWNYEKGKRRVIDWYNSSSKDWNNRPWWKKIFN